MLKRLVVLLLIQSLPLHAGARQPDDAARAFVRGKQLFKDKRYVGAIAAFEEAYRLRPHFMVQCSIARCHENLNKFVLAAEHYKQCLEQGAARSRMAQKINASLEAVEAQISRVLVRSATAGDEVFIDGRPVGKTPIRVPLNPGSHVLEVRREGARPARETVKTLGGESLTLRLTPLDLAPAEPEPRAESKPKVEPPRPAAEPPRPRRRVSRPWFWTAAGVTGALAVTAAILGGMTLKARSDYEESPTKPELDDFKSTRLATNIMWGLTAAAAAGTTVLFFYTDFGGNGEQGQPTASLGLRGTF